MNGTSFRTEEAKQRLALDGGADSAQVDTITHPRLVAGPDFYRRLEREWAARCAAVLCIDRAAWAGDVAEDTVVGTPGTLVGTPYGSEDTKIGKSQVKTPPAGRGLAGRMVTPTGLEPMSST
jgi:hypothetical protein